MNHAAGRYRTHTLIAGLVITAASVLLLTGSAEVAVAAKSPKDIYNCSDFKYQEDAQVVYNRDTSDPRTGSTGTTTASRVRTYLKDLLYPLN